MKEYKVIYKETLFHTFYVTADNEEDAKNLFNEEVNQGLVDFSYGEVVETEVVVEKPPKFSIKEIETGLYLIKENNGECVFGKDQDRIIFYDEAEADRVLERLNDITEHCYVLLDENI